jgi:hypothetical protein
MSDEPRFPPVQVFLPPPDEDAVVWRYIDFVKFVSLVDTRTLHLARADMLQDPFEGSLTQAIMMARAAGDTHMQRAFGAHVADRVRGQRGYVFVNCWSMSEHESAAMWPLYLERGQGVAIRSTFRRLCQSLSRVPLAEDPDNGGLYAGRVEYIDYATESFKTLVADDSNVLSPFWHKRKSFEHEHEVRVLWWDGESLNANSPTQPNGAMTEKYMLGVHPGGVAVDIDLSTLVEEVRVSPLSPAWYLDLLKSVVAHYGCSFPIRQSDLMSDPVF